MRVKDENKNDAIFSATIELLNEIGFADTSMSKIARKANVSSSTLYVYFENKDDMLKKTYLHVQNEMMRSLGFEFDDGAPVRDTVALMMRRLFAYFMQNPSYFLFSEQFDNSPLLAKYCLKDQPENMLQKYYSFFENAIARGIIKDRDVSLLIAYCYYPVVYLAKQSLVYDAPPDSALIEQAVELSWQAIKA